MMVSNDLFIELDPRPDTAGKVRRAVEERFGARLPVDFRLSLATVISELVNDSIVHGPGTPIRVRISVDSGGVVRGEIEDDGEGDVAIREIRNPTEGGLGLRIVDASVDRWGVYAGSTHVWFEMSSGDATA
jgi:two-component sensor histidine kinase